MTSDFENQQYLKCLKTCFLRQLFKIELNTEIAEVRNVLVVSFKNCPCCFYLHNSYQFEETKLQIKAESQSHLKVTYPCTKQDFSHILRGWWDNTCYLCCLGDAAEKLNWCNHSHRSTWVCNCLTHAGLHKVIHLFRESTFHVLLGE